MYQQNQNYSNNFPNQSARNFQNVPSGNQQNHRQFQTEMFPFGNRQPSQALHQFHGNQNQLLSPARINPSPMATNNLYSENLFHNNNAGGVNIERCTNNNFSNRGTDFERVQKVAHVQTQPYFAPPAVLIPQNNKNFSAQCKVDQNENQLLTIAGGSIVNKFETASVASNSDTVRSVIVDRIRKNENEKIRIFTGTPERIIHWHKLYNDYFCFYELIASVVSVQEGTVRLQKILLLRDYNNKGPIIQVMHYLNDHLNIQDFFVGQMLRCVGHMVGQNILHALCIREATSDEVTIVRRMCYIGDHAISKALKKS